MSATPITAERIAELKAKGYFVEDMGQEYGEEFAGQYRWMLLDPDQGVVDFDIVGYSEACAWERADSFDVQCMVKAT